MHNDTSYQMLKENLFYSYVIFEAVTFLTRYR